MLIDKLLFKEQDTDMEDEETLDETKRSRKRASSLCTKTRTTRTIRNLPERTLGGKTMKIEKESDEEDGKTLDNKNTHKSDNEDEDDNDDDKSSYTTAGDNDDYEGADHQSADEHRQRRVDKHKERTSKM